MIVTIFYNNMTFYKEISHSQLKKGMSVFLKLLLFLRICYLVKLQIASMFDL